MSLKSHSVGEKLPPEEGRIPSRGDLRETAAGGGEGSPPSVGYNTTIPSSPLTTILSARESKNHGDDLEAG